MLGVCKHKLLCVSLYCVLCFDVQLMFLGKSNVIGGDKKRMYFRT